MYFDWFIRLVQCSIRIPIYNIQVLSIMFQDETIFDRLSVHLIQDFRSVTIIVRSVVLKMYEQRMPMTSCNKLISVKHLNPVQTQKKPIQNKPIQFNWMGTSPFEMKTRRSLALSPYVKQGKCFVFYFVSAKNEL